MDIFKGSKEKLKNILENVDQPKRRKTLAKIGVGLLMVEFGLLGVDAQINRRVTKAVDLEDDEYSMAIPVDTNAGTKLVPADSLVIIDEPRVVLPHSEERISIKAISEDGEYITGNVESKYLKKLGKVSAKTLKEYTEIVTISDEGVQFKIDPDISDVAENVISNIPANAQVLKSNTKKIVNDEANWYGILYIDDKGNINELYGKQQDLLGKSFNKDEENLDKETSEGDITEEIISNNQNNKNEIVKEIKDIRMIVNTDQEMINFRSQNTIDDDNIILEIPNGATVYAVTNHVEENEDIEWRNVKYIEPETNIPLFGWVSNDFLEEYDEISKIVNTDSIGGITLKLRETPGGEIVDRIANGSKINIQFEDIINMEIDGNDRYVHVTLDNGDTGYVAYDYLEDQENAIEQKKPTEESKNKALSNYNSSIKGQVVGIDVSEGITAGQLEEMLKSNDMISTKITSDYHKQYVDTSEIAGKVNYVYIKIGASGYGEEGNIVEQYNTRLYREQARICEEYGVPYGFYYYSTCVTEEEAKREAAYINEAINLLDDREYNLLPFAIDFEWNKDKNTGTVMDRQYKYDDLTEEKALLSKLVSEKQGNVVLYTSGYLISDNSELKQLDLNKYNRIVGDKFVGLWLPSMIYGQVGEYGEFSVEDREYLMPIMKSLGKSYFEQIILDTKTNVPGGSKIDINLIDEDVYKKLIEDQYIELSGHEEVELER